MHFADKLCNKQALYRTLSISLSQFINEDERQFACCLKMNTNANVTNA